MNPRRHVGRQTGPSHTEALPLPAGGVALTTFVPWILVRRGVRTEVIAPDGTPQTVPTPKTPVRCETLPDTPLLRALGLAHHWQRLLDEQRVASVAEIAEVEGIDVTQVRRLMRLTLLAPEVIERLVGAPDIVLERVLRRSWPIGWSDQMRGLTLPA